MENFESLVDDLGPPEALVARHYVYSTLPSHRCTRLLVLQPAHGFDDELRCTIRSCDLYDDETPSYECISYTWGAAVFSRTLWVYDGGLGSPCRLAITDNLYDALRRFRHHNQSRLLWADAVCINQRDDVEKSIHIPLMTDIYRGAVGVLVWLGNEPEDERLLARINVVERLAHIRRQNEERFPERHEEELCACVVTLLRLPWFGRRWVIQEAAMNPNVVLFCGLMAVFDLWAFWALGQTGAESRSLHGLLEAFDHCGCADPRDRVFALAALANDVDVRTGTGNHPARGERAAPNGWRGEIVVDYGAPAGVIYAQTALMLANGGLLHWVLAQAAARPPSEMQCAAMPQQLLPSWVPDWRRLARSRPLWTDLAPMLDWRDAEKPLVQQLAGGDSNQAHLLRATFFCVRAWRRRLIQEEEYRSTTYVPRDVYSPTSDKLAPLAVTWRGPAFPEEEKEEEEGAEEDGDAREDGGDGPATATAAVLAWLAATFAGLWARVLAAFAPEEAPLPGFGVHHPSFAADRERLWTQCIDRLAYVVTGGDRLLGELGSADARRLRALLLAVPPDDNPKEQQPPNYDPGRLGPSVRTRPGRGGSGASAVQVWQRSDLVRRAVRHLGTAEPDPPAASSSSSLSGLDGAVLALIARTMRGRCVFACDVDVEDWMDGVDGVDEVDGEAAGARPAHARPANILGVGSNGLREGDRILSLAAMRSGRLTATTASDDGGSRAWGGATMLVREAATALHRHLPAAAEDPAVRELPFPPPVYRFVGYCLLTTSRWRPHGEGFEIGRWTAHKRWVDDTRRSGEEGMKYVPCAGVKPPNGTTSEALRCHIILV